MSAPGPGPNTATAAIDIHVVHEHIDRVDADAYGPYYVEGPDNAGPIYQDTTVKTLNPLNFVAADIDGGQVVGPPTGTVTIVFTVSISPDQSGDVNSDPDTFDREADLSITTNYINITNIPEGSGVIVTDPSGNVIGGDANFNNASGGGWAPENPGNLSYTYTGTFPIQPTLSIAFDSHFYSGPDGTFNNETTGTTPAFTWDFKIQANG